MALDAVVLSIHEPAGKSEAVLFTQKVAKGGDRARSFEDCLAVEVWLTGGDHGYAVHGSQRAVQGVR